ncbi:unnamed protein product [Didymodactylos carnosus]|uniref:Uncharacterized protein n=1 Tax=Didymodactylos carnosus TaxID=1234261 RepID=A0A814XRR4_9BILA|nr:unnamed protein product [Didymodactylos carnosus]CAF1219589.1 unnamed protein product [Didymodactylos carnosus]CAF3983135.1 unnamed protein product [Didymodactylos carnosus]CAF4010885.1 unnamed protein product [Didymodactylos carnosus]
MDKKHFFSQLVLYLLLINNDNLMSCYLEDCTSDYLIMTIRMLRYGLHTLHILVIVNIIFFILIYRRLIPFGPSNNSESNESSLFDLPSICLIPKFDPWHPTIAKVIRISPVYRCPTNKKPLVDIINYSQLKINQTVNQTLYRGKITHCVYYKIGRNPDEVHFRDYSYTLSKPILIQSGVTNEVQDADYVLTRCYNDPTILFNGNISCDYSCAKDQQSTISNHPNSTTSYVKSQNLASKSNKLIQEHVLTLMRRKKPPFSYEEWVRSSQNWWQKLSQPKIMPPSILFIILDAVSGLQAQRALPQTVAYLKSKGLYSFSRHSIVGDGTFDNIVPLFFGKRSADLLVPNVKDLRYKFETKEARMQDKKKVWVKKVVHYPGPFDNDSFIMKNFSRQFNYTTFFSEEWKESAFYNLKNGFHEQPTDFYLRPFWLSVYDSSSYNKFWGNSNPKPCYLNKLLHHLSLDWLKQFLEVHSGIDQPKFGILKLNEMSHDYMERLFWIDHDLKAYLEDFYDRGLLNNTILMFCGDHGHRQHRIRLTRIGGMEVKLPFFSMLLPNWFKEKFPTAVTNLANNRGVLTSWWDVYETLVNILNMLENPSIFDPLKVNWKSSTPGISLFHPIPDRNCILAGIPEKYCPCVRSNPISIETVIIKQLALYSVSYINNQKLKYHQHLCMQLELKTIIQAEVEVLPTVKNNKKNVTLSNFTHSYTVLFETEPSKAIFESKLLYDPSRNVIQLHSDMLRVNLYGQSSTCIQDKYELKSFCYCISYHQQLLAMTSSTPTITTTSNAITTASNATTTLSQLSSSKQINRIEKKL